jgi:hypothetical protein
VADSVQIRQQLQVHANDAQQQAVNLKRRAVDAEQQVDATRKLRKKRDAVTVRAVRTAQK